MAGGTVNNHGQDNAPERVGLAHSGMHRPAGLLASCAPCNATLTPNAGPPCRTHSHLPVPRHTRTHPVLAAADGIHQRVDHGKLGPQSAQLAGHPLKHRPLLAQASGYRLCMGGQGRGGQAGWVGFDRGLWWQAVAGSASKLRGDSREASAGKPMLSRRVSWPVLQATKQATQPMDLQPA